MRSTPHLLAVAAVAAAAALLQAACVMERQRELQGPIYYLQLSAVLYYLIHAGRDRKEGEGEGERRGSPCLLAAAAIDAVMLRAACLGGGGRELQASTASNC